MARKKPNGDNARLVRLEEQSKALKETVQTGLDNLGHEMQDYWKPVRAMVMVDHDRTTALETDMKWVKPWMRRVLYVGSGGSIIGLAAVAVKALVS